MDPEAIDSGTPAGADKNNPDLQRLLAAEDGPPIDPAMEWESTQQDAMRSDFAPQDPLSPQEPSSQPTAMTTTTRRNADGSTSSVFSGNRIRYLKKDDGVPLWRKDIQYLFLRYVFEDGKPVFTKSSDGTPGHTFADVYIDAMAKSSKCSQILKEKLLTDRVSAVHMAMICLLVNVGRMNTTLNFFPEMRARVRTYHAIPCLQAQQGSQAYKQLQDGPRLKSILKGAMEDFPQPSNIEELLKHGRPRTNPVNLIFVLAQYAPKVSEQHFFPPRDFFDLFMRPTLSSRSRATAFLWLIWWYLESDFSFEDSQRNPFGAGVAGDDGPLPPRVPPMEILTEDQAELENIDTEEEKEYGEAKRIERLVIVANDVPVSVNSKKGPKGTVMEQQQQQHNYRFRFSPLASSASDSGRPSTSPTRATTPDMHSTHPRTMDNFGGGRRRSPSLPRAPMTQAPTSQPALHGVKIDTLLNDENSPGPHSDSTSPQFQSRKGASSRAGGTRRQRHTIKSNQPPLCSRQIKPAKDTQRASSNPPFSHISPSGSVQAVQPSFAAMSYDDSRNPYHPMEGIATSPSLAPASVAPSVGGKRSRNTAPTIEQTRRERVNRLLYDKIRDNRQIKRRQRRQRGVVLDAWVKCSVLPSAWDSGSDDMSPWGGLDDFRPPTLANSRLDGGDDLTVGDVGHYAKHISRGFRRVGRILGGPNNLHLPKRRRIDDRTARGFLATATLEDASGALPSQHRPIRPAPPTDVDVPVPKPKRAYKPRAPRAPKRVSGETPTPADINVEPVTSKSVGRQSKPISSGRRRGARGRNREFEVNPEALRSGELGVPIGVFLGGAESKRGRSASGTAVAPTRATRQYHSSDEEYIGGVDKGSRRIGGGRRARSPPKSPHGSLPHLGAIQQRALLESDYPDQEYQKATMARQEDGRGSLGATEDEYDSASEHGGRGGNAEGSRTTVGAGVEQ